MENKRKALGKGLEQLFSNERIDFDNFERDIVNSTDEKDIIEIPLSDIRSNPYQPRKTFDSASLNELADSIKEHGIIQPIIVKKSIKGYELIAGERRTKAAALAGLQKIPAIIREFDDNEMMEIALIENIQREDLNAIEEAIAYVKIIRSTGITQEELAKKFSKSRSYITNLIGLLTLPEQVQRMITENKISMGHARVLSKLEDEEKIISLANKIISEQLSVRDIERLVRNSDLPKRNAIKRNEIINPKISIYEDIMREKIGTKVKINKNKIEIPYDSDKDLERILEILNIEVSE